MVRLVLRTTIYRVRPNIPSRPPAEITRPIKAEKDPTTTQDTTTQTNGEGFQQGYVPKI